MLKYILQRIGFAILTLLIIVFVVYVLTAQFAINPFVEQAHNSTQGSGNSNSTKELLEKLFNDSVKYHFLPASWKGRYDEFKDIWTSYKINPLTRFWYWLSDIFTNQENPFGIPYDEKIFQRTQTNSISELFFKYLKLSVIITVPAFFISAILGIALGIVAGYKRGTLFDAGINAFSLFFIALPSFIIAPILISLLLKLNVTPSFINPYSEQNSQVYSSGQIFISWLPPILIIVLGSLSSYITYTRNQVITVLTSNYVLIAKSKGLGTIEIFFKYVLRNISIPLAALLIPSYIGLLTGGIVIETYWSIPGTSQIIAQSFPNGEINIIMFNTVFFTFLGVMTTIVVDVSYTILDPRIKYSSKSGFSYYQMFLMSYRRNIEFKRIKQEGGKNDNKGL
ncbi:ABC transporter permease [Mycoplasmopsis canis]|uniref:Oligopeptide ABC transporter permease n=1 Tax=Mycoplasmopsis canis TaxID=29555 RepID=A0A0F6ZLH5_9BACT|nr:ABC transporter permease [Mycoplasmopsis canis]AKF41073.1 peptide ABC transporter permease [Mycoplasmopsis canis]AMD81189.1 peptide ABC transporter permease [Mycoplasmopsis canis PG 14]EIE39746.1 oligopeptide ABC transporter, permease protein OppB [Mycoplasmopsis canis PG 14]EIE40177.1 oligopeptide ABC transporter, permease protein OppB [Mycoplasmopsis canis UF33]EIE41531.1 oligopeptide ABC transporter, permease protein OppB [Mycoplasmopsis canis UFG1]